MPRLRRHKLLLDEMFSGREKFPQLNNFHDLKSISHDFKKYAASDRQVMSFAEEMDRIVITKNVKHYKPLQNEFLVGVIGIGEEMPPGEMDNVILAFLKTVKIGWKGYKQIARSPRKKPK